MHLIVRTISLVIIGVCAFWAGACAQAGDPPALPPDPTTMTLPSTKGSTAVSNSTVRTWAEIPPGTTSGAFYPSTSPPPTTTLPAPTVTTLPALTTAVVPSSAVPDTTTAVVSPDE
ncbi:hypothetical protein [Mycolicibacterium tokaiense]|uniref:hypothetical protein n=1 Tax=Mycolicibacterium tokaiense TaxID=39695 RepID=UPI0011C01EFD|nr:hypothetical protein [Mycolicibacterium tokaiense]BBY89889.1 hypothetical protein MTOK_56710 [Mycolicibacterium tokaiense]